MKFNATDWSNRQKSINNSLITVDVINISFSLPFFFQMSVTFSFFNTTHLQVFVKPLIIILQQFISYSLWNEQQFQLWLEIHHLIAHNYLYIHTYTKYSYVFGKQELVINRNHNDDDDDTCSVLWRRMFEAQQNFKHLKIQFNLIRFDVNADKCIKVINEKWKALSLRKLVTVYKM